MRLKQLLLNERSWRRSDIAMRSWLWPGRTTKRISFPIASVSATILLVKPPFERPMPSYNPLFRTQKLLRGLSGSSHRPIHHPIICWTYPQKDPCVSNGETVRAKPQEIIDCRPSGGPLLFPKEAVQSAPTYHPSKQFGSYPFVGSMMAQDCLFWGDSRFWVTEN